MTTTHIVICYRDETIRCFISEEYSLIAADKSQQGIFKNYRSIQSIDDAASCESAIWKAAQMDLSEHLELAGELLEKELDRADWEVDASEAKEYEALDATICKLTEGESLFNGLNKFYREDGDEFCWSDEEDLGVPWVRWPREDPEAST